MILGIEITRTRITREQASVLNVRSGVGTNYKVIRQLEMGQTTE
ncbi:SH3 domain-containing protein [Clostridium sp. AWRP]|nr:SH3 domain-containing protein [Clostridium sp. AWRP]